MVKVSLIIPCYNARPYIDKCMSAILEDELTDKELIFINDGSSDDTLTILKKYKKKYDNIVIIDQENSGQAVARNKALDIAKGNYIFFLDVDDYIEKDAIKKMYEYAEKNKYDYVCCDYYEHYNDRDIVISNYRSDDLKKNAIVANFAPWGKIISKKLIDKIHFRFCEGKIFEDIAVIPHLAACAKNPGYLQEPLIYYNMTNMSTTRQKEYKKKFEDIIYISDYVYKLFSDDKLIDDYREELKYIYLEGMIRTGVLKFANYNEGIKNIRVLRKNVKDKFSHLLNNKYYKQESFYRKLTGFVAVYFHPRVIRLLKKIKG